MKRKVAETAGKVGKGQILWTLGQDFLIFLSEIRR